jgi:hypothetical protein
LGERGIDSPFNQTLDLKLPHDLIAVFSFVYQSIN